jgi:hypothetical protein
LSSFLFWRLLQSDLSSQTIFSFTFRAWVGALAGYLLFKLLLSILNLDFPWFNWWTTIFGSFLATYPLLSHQPFFWQIFDNYFWLVALNTFLFTLVYQTRLSSAFPFINCQSLILSLIFVAFLVITHNYRKFSWYKSGRLGFIGFSSIIFLGLSRLLVAIPHSGWVYWIHLLFIAFTFIVGVFGVYQRSGRQLSEEKEQIINLARSLQTLKVTLFQYLRKRI